MLGSFPKFGIEKTQGEGVGGYHWLVLSGVPYLVETVM